MIIKESQILPSFPKIRGALPNIVYPCFVEAKLDGEANVYFNGCLISKASGKVRSDTPITHHLEKFIPNNIALLGELYVEDGMFGALYKFLSNQKSDTALRFGVFDVVSQELDGKPYMDRKEWLINIFVDKELPYCHLIPSAYIANVMALQLAINDNKDAGYEGLVAKNTESVLSKNNMMIQTQLGWVKLKHKTTCDCELVNLDKCCERGDVLFNGHMIGVKIVNKYKTGLQVGDILEIEHQGILSGGGFRHPVYRGKSTRKVTIL